MRKAWRGNRPGVGAGLQNVGGKGFANGGLSGGGAGERGVGFEGAGEAGGRPQDGTGLAGEVQPLTGYVRGGVTALACKKDYPVYIDETAILFERISVSAGVRGTQILLNPEDYMRAVCAVAGALALSSN